ncbi:probable G-protein coupled receptor Mth-like 1 isoform X2 [Scylla paramamosain]
MCDMLPTHPPLLLLLLLVVPAKSVTPGDLETVVGAASASRDESQVIQGGTAATDEDRFVVGRSLVAVKVQQNIVQGNPMLKANPWEKGEQDEEESGGEAPAKAKSLILLDEDTAHQHNYLLEETAASTPVRKCCELGFFSLQTQQCEAAPVNMDFEDLVQSLRQPDASSHGGVQLVTGPLLTCPDTGRTPVISEVVHGSHLLLEHGFLRSEVTGHDHDHDHYCLELAAPGPDQLEASIMVAAQCQPWATKILTRKCCALDQYYDHALEECRPKLANMSGHEELVREFIRSDAGVSSIKVQTGTLRCDRGAPRIVVADQAFLDASSQLCERLTGKCQTTSSYCVEWAAGNTTMTALAFVCPVEAFHKCCPKNYLLTETGCVLAGSGDVSARMRHLMEKLDPLYGFPTENGGQLCVRDMITPDDADVQWWISKNGYLSVNTRGDSHDTMRYCVDDYLGPSNKTQTVTILCQDDLEEASRVHLSQEGMVDKCCPHGYYLSASTYTCRPDDQGLELLDHPLVQAANITKLIFTSVPECQVSGGYHHYYVDPDLVGDDHALLSTDHMLEVVGLESGCAFMRHSLPRHAYCLDYTVNGSDRRPGVLVCAGMWQGYNLHAEKYDITSILLGVSCAAFFGTAFCLISTRVRRGLVTVKKVNTLAGRILLSYVFSNLVGFLLLMVNMKVELEERSSECQVIAWLLIFFLLGAFQWNTSICLESLLLTLHVETSETLRYLYHSLWAWGVPAFIASLALTLDHYRQSLPCSVITPKVGLYRCFFSDAAATLVYFYTPMLISLVANVVLLLLSRHLRAERLRKLECGLARNQVSDPERERTDMQRGRDSGKAQTPSSDPRPAQSGLRTHQTRNVWLESVKLVVWSGVTWLLEVVSFVISKYMVTPSESWYDYLWYVPSSVNALRGVGIFVILVLTPERRVQIRRTLLGLARQSGVSDFAKSGKGDDSGSISVDVPFRGVGDSAGPVRAATSPSSQPSDGGGPEQDVEAGAGCRRHSSLGIYVTHL